MNKEEFLAQLERNLQEISYEERQAALRYYEEYFEEAGGEEKAMEQLDSPEQIAKVIKDDLDIKMQLVKSSGKKDDSEKTKENQTENADTEQTAGAAYNKSADYKTTNNETIKIILIVVACVIFSPVILGGGFGAFGVLLGLLGTIFGITVAAGAMMIAGVATIVAGIIAALASPLAGIFTIGVGVLILGIGTLLMAFVLWFWGMALPALIHWIRGLFQKNRKEVAA